MRWKDQTVLVFDTETTGTNVETDRIVELGAAYFRGGVAAERRRSLIQPGVPIPAEATAIHGISDADVKDAPAFAQVAPRFLAHVHGLEPAPAQGRGAQGHAGGPPILAGYNARGFDAPLVNAELARAGFAQALDPDGILDVLIFARWHHRGLRVRNLESLCGEYGITLSKAHSAVADAIATGQLLFSMVDAGLIPDDVEQALALQKQLEHQLDSEWTQWSYWLYKDRGNGALRLGAGKHCGSLLEEVDPGYLNFLLRKIEDLPAGVVECFSSRVAP